jgi:hypothetical protein
LKRNLTRNGLVEFEVGVGQLEIPRSAVEFHRNGSVPKIPHLNFHRVTPPNKVYGHRSSSTAGLPEPQI